MMDLVVRHEFNRCIRKDTNECGRMALKKSSNARLSVYVKTCAKCTDKSSWQAVGKKTCNKIRAGLTNRHISESLDLMPGREFSLCQAVQRPILPATEMINVSDRQGRRRRTTQPAMPPASPERAM